MGLRRRPGQISLEYLLIIGFTFAIIIPGIYFFQSYTESSASGFGTAQYNKLGNEIVGTAVQTLAQGKGSWLTLDLLVPESVLNITVEDGGRELVITYLGSYGPTESVFFSDDVLLTNASGGIGDIYTNDAHGGRLVLKFYAGSNNNVSIVEDTGWWAQPSEYCSGPEDCLQFWREPKWCRWKRGCTNGVCNDFFENNHDIALAPGCGGNGIFTDPYCVYNESVAPDCGDAGWFCPFVQLTSRCRLPGQLNATSDEVWTCWYRPVGMVGPECNATGCHVIPDIDWGCDASFCNETYGWNNSLCRDLPYIASIFLNATDSPDNNTDANLTAWPGGIVNPTDGHFSILYDWRVNQASIAVVNMNFDVNDSAGKNMTRDYSTWENHGEIFNAVWNRTGGWNKTGGYEFNLNTGSIQDGSIPNHIIIPGDDLSTTNQSFTVSFWFSPTSYIHQDNEDNITLVEKREVSGADWRIHFLAADDGRLRWQSYYGNVRTTLAEWDQGDWYHITAVYKNNSDARIYVNGVEDNYLADRDIGVLTQHPVDIYLGMRFKDFTGNDKEAFKGSMDEFKVYKRALSAQEVFSLYENKTSQLTSQETRGGDTWYVCATPSDGFTNGTTKCSNSVLINNTLPIINSIVLRATDHPANTSGADLNTIVNAFDPDGYPVHILYDWRLNGASIAVVNMNFDVKHGANNKTKDYSSYSNNGTLGDGSDIDTMPTWTKMGGWNGSGAYVFDGDDDYIVLPDNLGYGDKISAFGWFKSEGKPSGGYHIIFGGQQLEISIHQTGYLRTGVYTTIRYVSDHGSGLTDGDWHFVGFTYDGASKTSYIDGVAVGSQAVSGSLVKSFSRRMGRWGTSDTYYANATLDEWKIFNRSLSAEQVFSLYQNRTDIIESEETTYDDKWSVCGTPNDGFDDGFEMCSNEVIILKPPCLMTPMAGIYTHCRQMNINYMSFSNLINYQVQANLSSLHPGLLGSWHFNEGAWSVAKDSSGNGHDGTIIGAAWAPGVEDDALRFQGPTQQYVDIGDDAAFKQNRYTITAWVNIPATVLEKQTIVGRRSAAWDETNYMLNIGTNGIPQIVHVPPDHNTNALVGTIDLRNTGWKHVAVTYNGSEQHLYVNGVSDISAPAIDPDTSGPQQVRIGHNLFDNKRFDGTIDEVRIYDHALSEAELREQFCIGSVIISVPPVGFTCDSYIKSFSYSGADYRFTNRSGGLYDHWLENDIKAWVKIPLITWNIANPPFYFYYGKKGAPDVSNPDATFILYDDFDGVAVDGSKWTSTTTGSGTITQANGVVDLSAALSSSAILSASGVTEPVIVERVVQFPAALGTLRNRFGPRNTAGGDFGVFNSNLEIYWAGSWSGIFLSSNIWFDMENILHGTTFTWRFMKYDTPTVLYENSISGAFNGQVSTATGPGRIRMDRLIARVYATNPPTITTGAEN